jgi:hypothetical protein
MRRRISLLLLLPRVLTGFTRRTVALLGILVCSGPLGCATTVQPGLANASAFPGSAVVDPSVKDVVANGRDACEGGLGSGPLRYQIPACLEVEQPAPPPAVVRVAPPADGVERDPPRWPCSFSENEGQRMTVVSPRVRYSALALGLAVTCASPLDEPRGLP